MIARPTRRRVLLALASGLLVTLAVGVLGAQTSTTSVGVRCAQHVSPPESATYDSNVGEHPIWQIDERRGAAHRRLRYWRMQISGMNLLIPIADFEAARVDLTRYPGHLRPRSLDDLFIYALYGECGWPLPALAYAVDDERQQSGRTAGWRPQWTLVLGETPNGNARVVPLRPLWIGLVVDTLLFGAIVLGLAELVAWWLRARRTLMGHCPSCGYDRRGLDGPCPECGAVSGVPA